MAALSDRSSKPDTYPCQIPPEMETRIAALRWEHPGWSNETFATAVPRCTGPSCVTA
jgi:hypothetical protein